MRVPKEFDADHILSRSPVSKELRADAKQGLKEAMYFILNSIIQQMETRQGRDLMDEDGLIHLHSDILGEVCGNRYKKALDILKEEGVIYRDDRYSSGSYSKGVCLLGRYATLDFKTVEIIDPKFKERVLKHIKEQELINSIELGKIRYITKWFNSKLTVNKEGVHKFVEHYKRKLLKLHQSSKRSSDDISNRINSRYNSSLLSVRKIEAGDFGLTRTGTDKRLHSAVSSMKKELRSFLLYNGEPLVGIDIKSSQPYLLNLLLKDEFYEKDSDGLDIFFLYPELKGVLPTQEVKSILMSVGYTPPHSFDEVNWEEDFYTYLIKLDEKEFKGVKRIFKTREDVKHTIMLALYDKKHKGAGFKRFEQMFPKEAALIDLFHKISGKGKNYLPILMQRLESKLMLEMVAKEVFKQLPDAPIITVHDCILTTKEFQEPVREIMNGVLSGKTKVDPGLKLENDDAKGRLRELDSTVAKDLEKIHKKGLKKDYPVVSASPLLYEIPDLAGERIISTKYVDQSVPDDDYIPDFPDGYDEPIVPDNLYQDE